ncbi:unnamed protein product [Brugia timori]|uniref:Copper transport protein ATOX1 n=2 Tax=Brugia TaxID=6278 RepID=A0A1P6CBP6_BRUMA|nr:BMA-CUC-1, isoform c [Brugia malayi]VDO42837.1 unnamed protein product [Brugia timori]
MANTYTFELNMTCDGCANAARKVLSKLGDDISDVQISIQDQRVVVTTTLPADSILAVLQKTGLSRFLLLYSTVLYLYYPVLFNYISVLEEENRIFVQFIIVPSKVLI